MSAPGPAMVEPHARLTEEALERHFRRMLPAAAVLALDDLSAGLPVGCVDGRRRDCVVGSPGGNAGLLIVLLAAWEQGSGQALSRERVEHLFDGYLDHFGSFYLHSDRAAQDRLAGALDVPAASVDERVRRPAADVRPLLLEALTEPAHMGCGHLRLMVEEPEAYGVRPELVRAVVRSYFARLWDGDHRLVLDILDGTHAAGGVARIRTESECPGHGGSPGRRSERSGRDAVGRERPVLVTACPHHRDLELFVYHPAAVEWLQSLHARFLARHGMIRAGEVPHVIQSQQRLGLRQLEATLRRLAPGLPVFDVRIEADLLARAPATVAVRLDGHVPPRMQETELRV